MIRYFLVLLGIALTVHTYSQQSDTVYYDTIHSNGVTKVVKNNLVVKDEVQYQTILVGFTSQLTYSQFSMSLNSLNNQVQNSFSFSPGYSLELTQYFLVNNYFIQTGCSYNHIQGQYDINDSWWIFFQKAITLLDTLNTHYYVIDGDSVPEYITQPYEEEVVDSNMVHFKEQGKNVINSIGIPVYLGYRWRFKKIAVYFKTGISFNFIQYISGKDYNFKEHLANNLHDKAKKTMFMTIMLGTTVEYPFSNSFSVILEPYFMKTFKNNNSYLFNHSGYGGKIGLQYWF